MLHYGKSIWKKLVNKLTNNSWSSNSGLKHSIIPASYLILLRKSPSESLNTVLLWRRYNSGYEDGNYSLPAGHVEINESFTQAMIREAKEEIGLDLKEQDLKPIHIMHRKGKNGQERIDVFFVAIRWEGEPVNLEPEKCDDLSWFSLNNLPKNMIKHVQFALEQGLQGNYYSEYGYEK